MDRITRYLDGSNSKNLNFQNSCYVTYVTLTKTNTFKKDQKYFKIRTKVDKEII